MTRWHRICTDPLWILAGIALAALLLWREQAPAAPDPAIHISATDQAEARARRSEQVSDEQVVADLVNEEILLREAIRLGLHRRDGQARSRLLALMRLSLVPEIPGPSREALITLLQTQPERFRAPGRVSFQEIVCEHGSVPAGLTAATLDEAIAEDLPFEDWNQVSESYLTQSCGADFVTMLAAAPAGRWQGPVTSKRGVHFVRVTERTPGRDPSFEEAEYQLREAWDAQQRAQREAAALDKLRATYPVVIE
ncbi:MAG: peptidylprolyl isomerase [Planctomycetota bacterium]|jgi:hypothetical protein|nr:peptidylprolyl isomerase [Planctomycetota bacterium]